jgi:hypothetical protein
VVEAETRADDAEDKVSRIFEKDRRSILDGMKDYNKRKWKHLLTLHIIPIFGINISYII